MTAMTVQWPDQFRNGYQMSEVKLPWKINRDQATRLIAMSRSRMLNVEPAVIDDLHRQITPEDLLVSYLFDRVAELEAMVAKMQKENGNASN